MLLVTLLHIIKILASCQHIKITCIIITINLINKPMPRNIRDMFKKSAKSTNSRSVDPEEKLTAKEVIKSFGPGLITGASDDDPSGIGTYSVAGAQFGFHTLWLSLVTFPLAAAVQEICARIGIVTGHGLITVIKKHYGKWMLVFVTVPLLIANAINIGADIQAMAATAQLLLPKVQFGVLAVSISAFTLLLLIGLSYKNYVKYLKVAALSLLLYVFVTFVSKVDWPLVLNEAFNPFKWFNLELFKNPEYIMTIVAILGTTISPYLFFWQANEEVEEEIASGVIKNDGPNTNHPTLLHVKSKVLTSMRVDVLTGMFYTVAIMFFIIVATGTNLYTKNNNLNIADLDLAQIANILKPLVGDSAFLCFAIGIIGIGLLAIPVLAGSASYAISELLGWQEGLSKKFKDAPGFYVLIITATAIGLSLNLLGISPVSALYYTAVINGILAVPLLIIIWLVSNNKKVLGEHTNGKLSNTLIVITILVMGLAAIAMFLPK